MIAAIKSIQAMNDAKEQAARQKEQQDKLIAEQEQARMDAEKQRKVEEDLTAAELQTTSNKNSRGRQRQLAKGAQGRRSTLLTSPLGEVGDLESGKKTLLGE
jgi:hypothetical protein